jgi:7-cyano-7-deazaguanine synthase
MRPAAIDCRPEFVRAFGSLAALATRAGIQGARFTVPLMTLDKPSIIRLGTGLGWTTR